MKTNNYYKNKVYKIGGFRKKAILEFIKKDSPKVLDIGCGNGELGEEIKRSKNGTVFGVEISEASVKAAKSKIDKIYLLDIVNEEIPEELKNIKFDYIIITEVLEHLIEPEKLLEKVKILMNKKTELIITVPNILFWKNRLKIFKGDFDYTNEGLMDRGHAHFFSWKSLEKTIWQTGYEIVKENHHIPTRGTKRIGKLFPGLFAFQFVIKVKKKRRVIYTAIFGGKDNLTEPKYIPDNFDFVCFTDVDFKSDVWQVRKEEPTHQDPVRSAKRYKILPHKFLKDYDQSIWIDGNMLVRGDVNKLIDKYLYKNNIAFYDHARLPNDSRNCVYEESDILMKMFKTGKYKDDPYLIKKQIEKYRKNGYPCKNGLISGMIILRNHNKKNIVTAMKDWWAEIEDNSRRDQLSFNYIAWKNNLKLKYIKGDSRDNKYFLHTQHKK